MSLLKQKTLYYFINGKKEYIHTFKIPITVRLSPSQVNDLDNKSILLYGRVRRSTLIRETLQTALFSEV